MPIIIPESYCALTEAYYGKSKELLEVERLLVPILDSIDKEYSLTSSARGDDLLINGKSINESSQLKKIEKLFCKVTGIGNLTITFYSGVSPTALVMGTAMNAFNLPSLIVDLKQKVMPKKVTRQDLDVKVFIDKGMIYNCQLTAGETVAIILHEIGHSLDQSTFKLLTWIIPDIRVIDQIFSDVILDIGFGVLLKTQEEKLMYYLTQYISQPFIHELYRKYLPAAEEFWNGLLGKIPDIAKTFNVFLNIMMQINKVSNIGRKIDIRQTALNAISPGSLFGYAGEKYADSVATAYGYGVETATGQRKIDEMLSGDNGYFKASNMPVVKAVLDLAKCTTSIPFMLSDPHPTGSIRIYSQLKKLRRELKNPDIPKPIAKEIESQIAELEEVCEDITDIRKNAKRGALFSAMWNSLMIKVFNGYGDPREILELIWRHEE